MNTQPVAAAWQFAPPYLLRHAAAHAAKAGQLESLLSDPGFLMYSDSATVLPYLDQAVTPGARLNAAVYRTSAEVHGRLNPEDRLRVLALDAARWGANVLSESLWSQAAKATVGRAVFRRTRWVTGSLLSRSLLGTMLGGAGSLTAVAGVSGAASAPLVVALDAEGGLWAWTLHTFALVGHVKPTTTYRTTSITATSLVDGTPMAITGCDDLTARVWDLRTMGQLGEPVVGHLAPVTAVASGVLANGSRVFATGSADGTAQVWDLESRQPLYEVLTGHQGAVLSLTLVPSANGPVLVTADQAGSARLWDLDTQRPAARELPAQAPVTAVASGVLANGSRVFATGSADGTAQVWDLESRQPLYEVLTGHQGAVLSLTLVPSANGPVLVTADQAGSARLWDLDTQRPAARELRGHSGAVVQTDSIELPDGSSAALTASLDGTVRSWAVSPLAVGSSDRQPLPRPGHLRPVIAVAVIELNGYPSIVSAAEDGSVQVRDLQSGQTIGNPLWADGSFQVSAFTIANSHGGASLALVVCERSHVQVWDLRSAKPHGKPLPAPHHRDRQGHYQVRTITALTAVAVPAGADSLVAGATEDFDVCVWNLQSRQLWRRPLRGHTGKVNVLLSLPLPDGGPGLASAGDDGQIRLWDLGTRRPHGVLVGHTGPVRALVTVTLPEGGPGLASAGDDGQIRLWDLGTHSPYSELHSAHKVPFRALAATDGPGTAHILAVASVDRTVSLWDLDETPPALRDTLVLPRSARTLAFADPNTLCVGFGNEVASLVIGERTNASGNNGGAP